jgi:hypothetical protein
MSHFIICSNCAMYFGTPNGQDITQFEHAMQRGFKELCTTPSGVFLIASAGQTRAQTGSSQCMHTCGAVCTLSERWMVSKWIMLVPRWVSHSPQACTHDWHPMQRE